MKTFDLFLLFVWTAEVIIASHVAIDVYRWWAYTIDAPVWSWSPNIC